MDTNNIDNNNPVGVVLPPNVVNNDGNSHSSDQDSARALHSGILAAASVRDPLAKVLGSVVDPNNNGDFGALGDGVDSTTTTTPPPGPGATGDDNGGDNNDGTFFGSSAPPDPGNNNSTPPGNTPPVDRDTTDYNNWQKDIGYYNTHLNLVDHQDQQDIDDFLADLASTTDPQQKFMKCLMRLYKLVGEHFEHKKDLQTDKVAINTDFRNMMRKSQAILNDVKNWTDTTPPQAEKDAAMNRFTNYIKDLKDMVQNSPNITADDKKAMGDALQQIQDQFKDKDGTSVWGDPKKMADMVKGWWNSGKDKPDTPATPPPPKTNNELFDWARAHNIMPEIGANNIRTLYEQDWRTNHTATPGKPDPSSNLNNVLSSETSFNSYIDAISAGLNVQLQAIGSQTNEFNGSWNGGLKAINSLDSTIVKNSAASL